MNALVSTRPFERLPVAAVLFIVSYAAARFAAESPGLARAAQLALVLLPGAAWTLLLRSWWGGIRELDELQRRIHFEALALAFGVTTLLLLVLGLLELVASLPPEDLSYRHVWAFMPSLYFFGQWVVGRRYR